MKLDGNTQSGGSYLPNHLDTPHSPEPEMTCGKKKKDNVVEC